MKQTSIEDPSMAQASALQRQGRIPEAMSVLHTLLQRQPEHFSALHLMGLLEAQMGRPDAGLALLDQAIGVEPGQAMAQFNRGRLLQSLGRQAQALEAMDGVLAADCSYLRAWVVKAELLVQLDQPDRALAVLDEAIQTIPAEVTLHLAHGGLAFRLNRYEQALASFRRAAQLSPGNIDAQVNAGSTLFKLSRHREALHAFDEALAGGANSADVHFNRGLALAALSRHPEAIEGFNHALRQAPALYEALRSRAASWRALRQFEPALVDLDAALKLAPGVAQAHANRATVLFELSRLEEAGAGYEAALALDPQLDFAAEALLQVRMATCDWRDFERQVAWLENRILQGRLVAPSLTLAVLDSPQLQRQCAEAYAAALYPAEPGPGLLSRPAAGRRLRIGYFSADFFGHATAYLMAGVFEKHDRNRFEVFAFSFGVARPDTMHERLRAAFEHFVDVSQHTDEEVAALSRQLGIDVAVDLKGLTQGSRPRIFAMRAAPVQIAYLGYPCTMGAPYMDYMVADRVVAGDDAWFTEKILCLPDSYQANDDARLVAPAAPSRVDFGLPANGFVFCSFNNAYKITPAVFAVWMRLLQQVEGSVLWLLQPGPVALRNLLARAAASGVDPKRIVIADRQDLPQHLARHAAADLFLDTGPCNAHTTASDALWAGLPVLTCQGRTFAGRVAASLLTAVGLPELIADSLQAYELAALALARDPSRLGALRERLAASRYSYPLFDTARFTRHLEAGYEAAHEALSAGQVPRRLDIGAGAGHTP